MTICTKGECKFEVLIPQGVRCWTAILLPDRETGEPRMSVTITAEGASEAVVLDLIRLTGERLGKVALRETSATANAERSLPKSASLSSGGGAGGETGADE